MGWISAKLADPNAHEGWLEACADRDGKPFDERAPYDTPVVWVRAACECGWRGPVVPAPEGTTWWPHSVMVLTQDEEDRLSAPWDVHIETIDPASRQRRLTNETVSR